MKKKLTKNFTLKEYLIYENYRPRNRIVHKQTNSLQTVFFHLRHDGEISRKNKHTYMYFRVYVLSGYCIGVIITNNPPKGYAFSIPATDWYNTHQ